MLKIDNKKEKIEIVGDSDSLKEEIGTLLLALCGEISKASKGAAEDMFNHIVQCVAGVAEYLESKCGVRLKNFHDDEKEEQEKPSISKDMGDAVDAFFNTLDAIIEKKKKGDK